MALYPHERLQDFDHDEKALQDFVTSFRAHLASQIRPGVREPFDAFMMEWATMNSNENFAAIFRETDLPAVATEVGFAEGRARMEQMPRIMEAKQQAYSDRAVTWPVLVGEK